MSTDGHQPATESNLADALFAARVRSGLTQIGLARKAQVSRETIRLAETGKTNPRADVLQRLCAVLELDPMALLGAGVAA